MKIQRALGLLFLGMALILTACKVENTADTTTELAQNKNSTTSGVDTTATEITPDEEGSVVRGTPDDNGLGQLTESTPHQAITLLGDTVIEQCRYERYLEE